MSIVIACSKIWNESLVKNLSKRLGQNVILITNKEDVNLDRLSQLGAHKIFFPHWSHIIPNEIHSRYECVIFHMTDLPYGRGGSPLQNLILNGHKHTKISAIVCSDTLDAGDVYLKRDLDLTGNAQSIFERATDIIEEMIVEIVDRNPKPVPQSGEIVEFKRRKPEESNLSSVHSLEETYTYIRMLDAECYPKAFLDVNGVRYEFSNAKWEGKKLVATVRIMKDE